MEKVKGKKRKTIKRLLKYVTENYKLQLVVVLVSIIISALVGVLGTQFIKYLIDDFITPLLGSQSPDYSRLLNVIMMMAVIYLVGVVCSFTYNRLMVNISQGVLNKIRTQMFNHMQKLPIRYFDSRTHGEIMSTYTNDVDTLRQMLSQSIPQVFSSCVTMVAVLAAMLATNIYLTLVVLGPIGIYVGNGIQFVYDGLMGFSTILGGALIGGLWCVCVIFGAHRALLPIGLNDVAVNGHQNLLAFAGAANFSQGGAAFGIMLRTKKKASLSGGCNRIVSAAAGGRRTARS